MFGISFVIPTFEISKVLKKGKRRNLNLDLKYCIALTSCTMYEERNPRGKTPKKV